jgi:hypothetical protein
LATTIDRGAASRWPKEVQVDRRAFVRLVGGGVVVAGGASAAGCSSGMPAEAVQAWQGPTNETDLRRWILGWAILAPHSHNLQSWLVDLRTPGEMLLRCDRTRLLPETDPFSRQMMMSQGTFIELIDLAAREKGHRCEIALFPEGEFGPERIDDRPVARIRLVPDASVARDPLFAQIARRHTNRNAYELAREIPATAWQAMAAAGTGEGLRFGHTAPQDPALPRHREIASQAWRIELSTARTMLESLKVMRVGSAEIAKHRDGLSIMSPFMVALDTLGLFDRTKAPAPDSMAVKGQVDDFNKKIATTPAFLWMVSQGNSRATQVNAGRAYARVQLAATAQGVVMHPLQQALQEYAEVAQPYAAVHELLQAPRPDNTVQMWARVGFAEPVGPAPRRPLDSFLAP